MGIASLVLGIIALVTALIPLFGTVAFFPALIGLGLGIGHIATASRRQQPKGAGIAGVVLNGVAALVVVGWVAVVYFFGRAMGDLVQQQGVNFGPQSLPTVPTAPAPDPNFKPMTPVDEPEDSDSAL